MYQQRKCRSVTCGTTKNTRLTTSEWTLSFGTIYFIAPFRSSYSILLPRYNTTSLNPSNPPWPIPCHNNCWWWQEHDKRTIPVRQSNQRRLCTTAHLRNEHLSTEAIQLSSQPHQALHDLVTTQHGVQWSRLRTDRASIPEFIVSKSKLFWCARR